MLWNERGPGLLGLVRWNLFCFRIDPALIGAEDVLRALTNKGLTKWTLDSVVDDGPMPAPIDRNGLAIEIARQIYENIKAPEQLEPVRVHWFTAKRV